MGVDTMDRGFSVITGASGGIGAALARALARRGHRLALVGRDATRLETVAAECRVAGAECRTAVLDIRDTAAFAVFLAELEGAGGIDLFLSNAGILEGRRDGEALETGDVARRVLDTNLLAAIEGIHLVLPGMRARRRGAVLFVSSLAAFAPLPDAPAYAASKAGLLSYGLALRDALEPEGITVCVACPGYVASAMGARHRGHRPGEIPADDAADRILTALDRKKALAGFPFSLFWTSRLALLAPTFIRRLGMRNLRFHVADSGR